MVQSSMASSEAISTAQVSESPSTIPSTSTLSPSATQSSPPAKSSTAVSYASNHRLGIGVGSAVGFVILVTLVLLGVLCWRKHQRRKRAQQGIYHQPRLPSEDSSMGELRNVAQPTSPPRPDPYSQPFPSEQTLPLDGAFAANRSQFNSSIIPDHDREQNRQPNLRHIPPLDPYHIPPPPPAAFQNPERYSASRPPSYRTYASSPSHRRPVTRSQRPGIPEVPND